MTSAGLLRRLGRYGAVGVLAAVVHLSVLISLEMVIPSWLANPLAFLAASVAGYLGHALVTFREETGGRRFARLAERIAATVNEPINTGLPGCGLGSR